MNNRGGVVHGVLPGRLLFLSQDASVRCSLYS